MLVLQLAQAGGGWCFAPFTPSASDGHIMRVGP